MIIDNYTSQRIISIAQPALSSPLNRYGEKTFGTPATIIARVQYETAIDEQSNEKIVRCFAYCAPTVTCAIGSQVTISGIGDFEVVAVRDLYDIAGQAMFRKITACRTYANVN